MNRIAVTGASGRMGQTLIRLLNEQDALTLVQATDHAESNAIGLDCGEVAGLSANGITIANELDADAFDVLVDFTHPTATAGHVAFCRKYGKGMVIGTTGLDLDQRSLLAQAGTDIPLVLAANTSVGVNLCAALAATAASVLGKVTDIEIIEAHHRHKVDAPSGTALFLGQAIADVLDKDLDKDGVYARHGQTGARKEGTIGFSTIRGGDIAGEHTILFIGENERLEITHKATDRIIFGRGALRVAAWVAERQQAGEKGLFGMQEVLGLN